jgi:hypothetical protein
MKISLVDQPEFDNMAMCKFGQSSRLVVGGRLSATENLRCMQLLLRRSHFYFLEHLPKQQRKICTFGF